MVWEHVDIVGRGSKGLDENKCVLGEYPKGVGVV